MPTSAASESTAGHFDLGPLGGERSRIDRIVTRLDEADDPTERADLGSELVRSTSRYEDTLERTVYPRLAGPADADPAAGLKGRLDELRTAMTVIHERTRHMTPRNVHQSDPQGFEDALDTVVRLLSALLVAQDAELKAVVAGLSVEDAHALTGEIAHVYKVASERPEPPKTALGRLVANANVKLDHIFEDVSTPHHPGAETIDG